MGHNFALCPFFRTYHWVVTIFTFPPNLPLKKGGLVATPHIAGYSAQGKANATALAVQALSRHFGLPLDDWQPSEVKTVEPKYISWTEMCATIEKYCNLLAESDTLRDNPELFELLRNNYHYREEYF